MSLHSVPAVLLRSHPWGESSHILRFLTPGQGIVGVVGRGVRRVGGKGTAPLELFAGGVLHVDLRPGRDLQGFRGFEVDRRRGALAGNLLRYGAASFLAEFILRHGGEDEGSPELFDAVVRALDRLEGSSEGAVVPHLVSVAWRMVSLMGYTPELACCVLCGARIPVDAACRFDHSEGGVRGAECGEGVGPRLGPTTRATLVRMLEGEEVEHLPRPAAHLRLVHDFVAWHLGTGRPLESFTFLAGALPEGDGEEGDGRTMADHQESARPLDAPLEGDGSEVTGS